MSGTQVTAFGTGDIRRMPCTSPTVSWSTARGAHASLRGVGLGNWLLPEGYMWRFADAGRNRRGRSKP